jgi:hypothetical protein
MSIRALIAGFIVFLFTLLIIFMFAAFVAGTFDILKWGQEGRFYTAFLGLILAACAMGISMDTLNKLK